MGTAPSPCSVSPDNESNFLCGGHLKRIYSCRTLRIVPPQFEIFSQGESPHTVCFICNGLVKLTRTEADGERAIVGLRKTGWLLGAAAVLPVLPYASTAETVTRSQLCFLPVDGFRQAMETNVQFAHWVSTMLARGVYSSVTSISERSCLSGRQRLKKFLREVTDRPDWRDPQKAIRIPIALRRWEVAQLLALTPEHLCRLLRQMENERVIVRKKGWLIFPEPKRLSDQDKVVHDVAQAK